MLDQCAQMCFKGNLIIFHLVLFFKRHIGVNHVKLMSTILDAMYSLQHNKPIFNHLRWRKYNDRSNWRHRLIAWILVYKSHFTNLVYPTPVRPHCQENHLICWRWQSLQNCPFIFYPSLCASELDYWIQIKMPLRLHLMGRIQQNATLETETPSSSPSACARQTTFTNSSRYVVDYCCSIIAYIQFHKRFPGHNTNAKLGHLSAMPGSVQFDHWPLHQFWRPHNSW